MDTEKSFLKHMDVHKQKICSFYNLHTWNMDENLENFFLDMDEYV